MISDTSRAELVDRFNLVAGLQFDYECAVTFSLADLWAARENSSFSAPSAPLR